MAWSVEVATVKLGSLRCRISFWSLVRQLLMRSEVGVVMALKAPTIGRLEMGDLWIFGMGVKDGMQGGCWLKCWIMMLAMFGRFCLRNVMAEGRMVGRIEASWSCVDEMVE